jgi:hypothetical protein
METTVRVLGETMKAIIDSGADINYVNKDWCSRKKINYKITGYGKIRAYNETYVHDFVRKATFEFEINGEMQRQTFHVLAETGNDDMVLGMPWLENENPRIDWKKRTVEIQKKSGNTLSNGQGNDERTFAFRSVASRKRLTRDSAQGKGDPRLARERGHSPDSQRIGRATLERKDRTHPDIEGKEYEKELEEVRKRLPKELWKYFAKRNSNYRTTDLTI